MSIDKDKDLISAVKDSGELKTDGELMQELLTPTFEEEVTSLLRDVQIVQTTNFLVILLCAISCTGVLANNYYVTVIPLTLIGIIMTYLVPFRYKRKKYSIAFLHLLCVVCMIVSVTVQTMAHFEIGVFG